MLIFIRWATGADFEFGGLVLRHISDEVTCLPDLRSVHLILSRVDHKFYAEGVHLQCCCKNSSDRAGAIRSLFIYLFLGPDESLLEIVE